MASRKKAAGTVKKKVAARPRAAGSGRRTPARPRSGSNRRTSAPARPAGRRSTAAATRRARPAPLHVTSIPSMTLLAPNGRPVESGIGLTHHHMDFSSHDLEGVRRFFVETLGFTNLQQVAEANDMTIFVTPTSSLGFHPPTSTAPDQWQPPGEPNLYFFVSDVDAVFAKLSAEGVLFDQAPTDMPWGHRVATLRDPEGRRVCLAQNLQR
jgi:catechol 2,3-dioxygenase-like lactoylglutathione lyase family enzyme